MIFRSMISYSIQTLTEINLGRNDINNDALQCLCQALEFNPVKTKSFSNSSPIDCII